MYIPHCVLCDPAPRILGGNRCFESQLVPIRGTQRDPLALGFAWPKTSRSEYMRSGSWRFPLLFRFVFSTKCAFAAEVMFTFKNIWSKFHKLKDCFFSSSNPSKRSKNVTRNLTFWKMTLVYRPQVAIILITLCGKNEKNQD